MADTSRTRSALLSLFADNVSGDISPQDVRDYVVSVMGGVGGLYVMDSTVTQAVGSTWVKVDGFTNAYAASTGVTASATANTLTPAVAGTYLAVSQMSFSGSINTEFEFGYAINGSTSILSGCHRYIGTGGDVGSASVMGLFALTSTQALQLSVKAGGAGKSITLKDGQFIITRQL